MMTIHLARCNRPRRALRLICALGAATLAAACGGGPRAPQADGPAETPAAQQPAPAAPAADARVDLSAPAVVALLAPLSASGDAGTQAQGIADAARLAIEERGGGAVELVVLDTGGSASGAASAARQALGAGAALVLGPLFGANVDAVAAPADQRGVNVIAFSTDPNQAGGNVWLAGHLASDEAARITSFAASRGLTRFGIFRPSTAYGAVAGRAIREAVYDAGGQIVADGSYQRSFEGIQAAAPGYAQQQLNAGADAVVLPEEGQGLRSVAAFLAYNGVTQRRSRYLGLGVWAKDPGVVRESALQGGWFAAPDPFRMAAFEERYQSRTGSRPPLLAHLGYDAAAAAVAMVERARSARDDTPFDAAAITDPGGFPGAAGALRFTEGGLNRRALAVLEVDADGFLLADPAPDAAAPALPGS